MFHANYIKMEFFVLISAVMRGCKNSLTIFCQFDQIFLVIYLKVFIRGEKTLFSGADHEFLSREFPEMGFNLTLTPPQPHLNP